MLTEMPAGYDPARKLIRLLATPFDSGGIPEHDERHAVAAPKGDALELLLRDSGPGVHLPTVISLAETYALDADMILAAATAVRAVSSYGVTLTKLP